jgi:hypothetical protein
LVDRKVEQDNSRHSISQGWEKTRSKVLASVWQSRISSAREPGHLKSRYRVATSSRMKTTSAVYKSYLALERDFRVVRLAALPITGRRGIMSLLGGLIRRFGKISLVYDVSLLGLIELLQTRPEVVRPPSDSGELSRLLQLLPGIFCAWDRLKERGFAKLAWETLKHVCREISLPSIKETRIYQIEARHPFGVIYKTRPDFLIEGSLYEAFFGIVSQAKGAIPDELRAHGGTPQQFSELFRILLEDLRIALLCICMHLHKEAEASLDAAGAGRDKGRLAESLDPSFCRQHSTLLKPFLDESTILRHLEEVDGELRNDGLDTALSLSNVARKLILNESPVMDDYLLRSGESLQHIVARLRERLGRDFEARLEIWFSNPKVRAEYLSFLQSQGLKREEDIYNLDAWDQVRIVTSVAEWVMERIPPKRQ